MQQSALNCIRQWHFKPALYNGVPAQIVDAATIRLQQWSGNLSSPPRQCQPCSSPEARLRFSRTPLPITMRPPQNFAINNCKTCSNPQPAPT